MIFKKTHSDAAKFGQSYLQNFGWDPSKGLGASGDGRTTHITVAQKLNMLGIGAGSKGKDEKDGIAWKQNRDFEQVLAKLNGTLESPTGVLDGFLVETKRKAEPVVEGEKSKKKRKVSEGDQITPEITPTPSRPAMA